MSKLNFIMDPPKKKKVIKKHKSKPKNKVKRVKTTIRNYNITAIPIYRIGETESIGYAEVPGYNNE